MLVFVAKVICAPASSCNTSHYLKIIQRHGEGIRTSVQVYVHMWNTVERFNKGSGRIVAASTRHLVYWPSPFKKRFVRNGFYYILRVELAILRMREFIAFVTILHHHFKEPWPGPGTGPFRLPLRCKKASFLLYTYLTDSNIYRKT